ncbi:MAG: hypothetical protein HY554_04995 [Elusimicrobia bacterium]|nr:hypothetical protein [Elusimicrobiota bacterium]
MPLGAVAAISVKDPAVLRLPEIHRVASEAMIQRFRVECVLRRLSGTKGPIAQGWPA